MGKWFLEDFSSNSECLVVAFGSFRMFNTPKSGKRGFEWTKLFKHKYNDLDFNKLYVADVRNSWWHTEFDGLSGIGPLTLKKFLFEKIKKANTKKTLYVGVSMGGYGVLLFGCLTEATKVMAFSPQTYLSKGRRERSLTEKFEGYDVDESMTDLKPILENSENDKTIYKIWYGSLNKSDSNAASRISHIKNVNIYTVNSSNHNVIKSPLKTGVFRKELIDFIEK